ncbi:MAG: MerR family transcriptional regulator [Actinomycetota bacterium]|nr:MerR family transcriptional regulator [Actinomycetota bacterium]
MRYRVDQLAARAGLSVDTVRFYQSRSLVPPPERHGRIALYSDDHLGRLTRIRDLKNKGFTLQSIKRMLDGEVDADEILAVAVGEAVPGDEWADESLTLDQLAAKTGVSPALLRAIEREGLLAPRIIEGEPRYTPGDAAAVSAGLELLAAGLPLSELLDLARRHDEAMHTVAEQAVELFVRYVRDPIHASATSEEEAAGRLVEAFRRMLPATTSLVAHHFRRVVLAVARDRIGREGLLADDDLESDRAAEA